MTDFVIVVAALASLASATPTTAPLPTNQPTVGFITYRTADACEAATTTLVARAGTRLVCVPVEQVEQNATN